MLISSLNVNDSYKMGNRTDFAEIVVEMACGLWVPVERAQETGGGPFSGWRVVPDVLVAVAGNRTLRGTDFRQLCGWFRRRPCF